MARVWTMGSEKVMWRSPKKPIDITTTRDVKKEETTSVGGKEPSCVPSSHLQSTWRYRSDRPCVSFRNSTHHLPAMATPSAFFFVAYYGRFHLFKLLNLQAPILLQSVPGSAVADISNEVTGLTLLALYLTQAFAPTAEKEVNLVAGTFHLLFAAVPWLHSATFQAALGPSLSPVIVSSFNLVAAMNYFLAFKNSRRSNPLPALTGRAKAARFLALPLFGTKSMKF